MIGFFDSGYGGLTVLKSVHQKMPSLSTIYLGDNARAPYGSLSSETIYRYTKEAVYFLKNQGAHLIILACNTASVHALRRLQAEIKNDPAWENKNILGITVPTLEKIVENSPLHSRIGVIGTKAMIDSHFYQDAIVENRPDLKVFAKACPLLVPLIEEGFHDKMECRRILKYYLRNLKSESVDILVPACTHYPLLMQPMIKIMGKHCQVLDPCENLAEKLESYLEDHPKILLEKTAARHYFTTGDSLLFQKQASLFLEKAIQCEMVSL